MKPKRSSYSLDKRRPKHPLFHRFKAVAFGLGLILIGGGLAFGILFGLELRKASEKIPKLPHIMAQLVRQPTRVMSADGQVLAMLTTEYRQPVKIQDVPKVVINATLAAEDRRFYQHSGVDYIAMVRAVFVAAKGGHLSQGGSTLTMQIAKRIYSEGEHSLKRKLQDLALAVMIERQLTKDQILELYLNQVYYGAGAYGIQAAADVYFGKSLKQLTVADAALLARLVKRPSSENPYVNLEKAVQNRNFVIKTMLEDGMIDEGQYDKAIQEKPLLRKRSKNVSVTGVRRAPYFVDYILAEVKRHLPDADLSTGGYRIDTTLNVKMQDVVECEMELTIQKNRYRGMTTAAFVLTNRQGQILAMTGGGDYHRNQYNMMTQGRRQPGSSFKPFVYAVGLETGAIKPDETFSNERYVWQDPVTGQVWAPKNANGKFGGSYSVKSAIALSLNLPVIRAAEKTRASNVAALSRSLFGFESHLDPVLALALGCSAVCPLEMVQGYSVFMLKGDRATPYGLTRILASDGKILREFSPKIKKGVLSSQVAEVMDGFLRTAVTSGTGKRANIAYNARGKTGTTSNHWDVWFCGYTDELLGVGWAANEVAGKDKGPRWLYKSMPGAYGGGALAPTWGQIMRKTQVLFGEKDRLGLMKKEQFERPEPEEQRSPKESEPKDAVINETEGVSVNEQIGPGSGGLESARDQENGRKQSQPTKEQISLEVCAQTYQKANGFCPGIVIRSFKKGQEPKSSCSVHKSSDL